jgi:putative ABC transport system permease protein
MPMLPRLASLWRTLAHRTRREADLDAELASYVALLTDQNVRAGMTESQARRAALVETGGVQQVKEEVRDVRAGAFLERLRQDIRFGVRSLRRTPAFALAAIVALGLGIGANTAILSVVNAVLLRPLAYADPDRLVVILHRRDNPVAPQNYLDWKRDATTFERMGAAEYWTPSLTGQDTPEKLWGLHVTSDIFPMLGVRPLLGRVFLPEEDQVGRANVAVIGYGLWQRRFAGDPGAIGRTITLDGHAQTIVGVMPQGFTFAPFWATQAEIWAPLALGERATQRGGNSLRIFARLAPHATMRQAVAQMATITAHLEQQLPGTNRDVTVVPLTEKVVGDVRPALLVLLGAVGFVLLMACANVAHMLLARGAARHREIALRTVLGATRARVVQQLLTESVVLALAGGALGLVLAVYGVRALVALGPTSIPRLDTVGIDGRVLAGTVLLSLLTGIAFGLLPALQASRQGLGESLREGDRGSTEGGARSRLRNVLVASEFALALMLLVGAGLMIRSFRALQSIDAGFDPRGVLSLIVSVTGSREAEPARRGAFYRELVERVRALPGVDAASGINHLPIAGDIWGWPFAVVGHPKPQPGDEPTAAYRIVLPGYFATMRIPLLRGRDVAETDVMGAPPVVVINEIFATRHWPGEDPIGKRITLGSNPDPITVVGVVKNSVRSDWAAPAEEEFFFPAAQRRGFLESPSPAAAYITLVVRTSGDPAALAPTIRSLVWSFDSSLPISETQTMSHVVAEATAGPRFNLLMLATFAGVALVLAAVGIYGVMSYAVSRRTHEIGVRMALGARSSDVLRLIVRQGMTVASIGALAGIAGALALTRAMATLLYGVRPTDPATFVAVPALLAIVALAACYLPARRAAKIDPMVSLRSD